MSPSFHTFCQYNAIPSIIQFALCISKQHTKSQRLEMAPKLLVIFDVLHPRHFLVRGLDPGSHHPSHYPLMIISRLVMWAYDVVMLILLQAHRSNRMVNTKLRRKLLHYSMSHRVAASLSMLRCWK